MLTLHRRDLTAFRTVFRRCRPTRAPDPNQLLRVTASGTTLRFLSTTSEVTLGYARDGEHRGDDLDWCLPGSVLDVAEQTVTDAFELHPVGKTRVRVRWPGGEREIELVKTNRPAWPENPDRWGQADGLLLTALHEVGRTADRSPGRCASHRVQLQGDAGRVVGTDTKQALIWDGFRFPFTESVLVPAVAAFGSKEWKREAVRVGRTKSQVVFVVGPWTLGLTVDPSAKFPDATAIVPKAQTPTVIHLSEDDARLALSRLGAVPDDDDETNAVTLDAMERGVAVRWRLGDDKPPSELRLSGSRSTGPAVRYAFDRQYLLRGLALGFRTLRVCGAHRPLAMTDRHRLYLAAGHDPSTAIPPDDTVRTIAPNTNLSISPIVLRSQPSNPEPPMPIPPTRTGPPPDDDTTPDPLAEAEAVRDLLAEAAQRANLLVQMLKAKRKADRAITQAVRSLRALPLGGRA